MSLAAFTDKRFFVSTLALTILCIAAIALFSYQRTDQHYQTLNQYQQESSRRFTSLVVEQLNNPNLTSAQRLEHFNQLIQVSGLTKACLYINTVLTNTLLQGTQAPCPRSANASGHIPSTLPSSTLLMPFSIGDEKSALLVVQTTPSNPRSPLTTTGILIVLLLSWGGGLWVSMILYFRAIQKKMGLARLDDLESVCNDIVHNRHFKHHLPEDQPYPLNFIAHTLNAMLDELLRQENQLQEHAIQLREKKDQIQAQKKLFEDHNETLQKMFAGASHDLKQPLQAMHLFIAAIKEHANTKQQPHIDKLEQVLDNLNELFSDLLDISKIESRMQKIPKRFIETQPLLEKIFNEFEPLAADKNIQLKLFRRQHSVYTNPNMLERIIRNMISNAIRYTRKGGVLIGSRMRDGEVWIEVRDTGRGIPPEKMNEIFNEFVQLNAEDPNAKKGVGLGLFIVKKLAQLLDHSIIVKSKLRKGTLFRVIIPSDAPVVKNVFISPSQQTLPPFQLQTPSMSGKISIVIDDDDGIRHAMQDLLIQWGFKVQTFSNIQDAAQYAAIETQIDLIISDFQLAPNQTGLEAVEEIKKQIHSHPVCLIITGTEDENHLERIRSAGIPLMKKPVNPAKLRAMINVLLNQ